MPIFGHAQVYSGFYIGSHGCALIAPPVFAYHSQVGFPKFAGTANTSVPAAKTARRFSFRFRKTKVLQILE